MDLTLQCISPGKHQIHFQCHPKRQFKSFNINSSDKSKNHSFFELLKTISYGSHKALVAEVHRLYKVKFVFFLKNNLGNT